MIQNGRGAAPARAIRCCMIAAGLASMAGRASAQALSTTGLPAGRTAGSVGLNSENLRVNRYLHDLAGPGAFISVLGGSVVSEIRGGTAGPDDWKSRLAARALQRSVDVSVRHGVAALMHHSTDDHYQPCHCRGFGRKVGHALVETFTDRRDDGSRALAIPELAGSYAGGLTELAWRHDRSVGNALVGSTISLGTSALFNIARELTGLAQRLSGERATPK